MPGPYQRPPYLWIILIQTETNEPRSGICIEPHSGICSYSNIAGVLTFFNEWVRDCAVRFGGSGMLGDIEEVEGRQSKRPGGANGRHGGKGKEFKYQVVGKGRRITEGDRHGGIGVASSEERAGPEDCRHRGI